MTDENDKIWPYSTVNWNFSKAISFIWSILTFRVPSLQKRVEFGQSHGLRILFRRGSYYRKELQLLKKNRVGLSYLFYVDRKLFVGLGRAIYASGQMSGSSLRLDCTSTLPFNHSKACLIIGLLCIQLQLGFRKPIPLIQEHVRALIDLSSHQSSDDLANEGCLFSACYRYGRLVRERTGLEESFLHASPVPRLSGASPTCSVLVPAPLQSSRGTWWGFVGR